MDYILILTIHADPALPPGYSEWGGTHTYMKELLDCLEDAHIRCILITRRCMEELPYKEQYSPYCTIFRLQNGPLAPIDKTLLRNYHNDNVTAIKEIINSMSKPPLIIHSVYWNSGRIGVELANEYNIPLVHSVISNSRGRISRGAKEPIKERASYEQLIFNFAKWILCVSEDEKTDLIQFYNIQSEKIIVAGQYIHPSFVTPCRDKDGFPRLNSNINLSDQNRAALKFNDAFKKVSNDSFWNNKVFTYLGRIDMNKGVDHVIAAWGNLYKKYDSLCPPLWLIGGSIKEISQMREKAQILFPSLKQAEKENKIVWWGCLDSIGISTLLLKTMVLVTNSLYEPGGRVITEAMCEGIPAIAAPNGFALDLIHDWYNGFLVEHGDEKSLYIRMEHFIRQPFLANTLGANARNSALKVIKEWNFFNKHLFAYGIRDLPIITNEIITEDKFRKREVNIYPYRNLPFSTELLSDFLKQCTGESLLKEPIKQTSSGTSDIYYICGDKNNYIIKHPFSRLALGTLIVPVKRNNYIRNAIDFYRFEILAYQSAQNDILVGKDDFHQLLLLKKLEPFSPSQEDYAEIINYICTQYSNLSFQDSQRYNRILKHDPLCDINDLEVLIDRLELEFPDYYFELSGTYLPYVGWKTARFLIEYNKSVLDAEHTDLLFSIYNTFSHKTSLIENIQWCEINSDITLEHIMLDNGKYCMIDREKRTIGIVEYMIADIILDIYIQNNCSIQKWIAFVNSIIQDHFDIKQIVESLAYKLFYRVIIECTLNLNNSSRYFDALKILNDIEQDL